MAAEFLMLADTFKSGKHKADGMYVSEKLDGTRAFWDGGLSRGDLLTNVPWANIYHPKTGELKKGLPERSTGLWSRYGNPIMAPPWFLNELPCMPLDGELWAGRGNFQTLRSVVAQDIPDERWKGVHYVLFGSPSPANVFKSREIKGTNFRRNIKSGDVVFYTAARQESGVLEDFQCLPSSATFDEELRFLATGVIPTENVYMHRQLRLSTRPEVSQSMLQKFLDSVLSEGGEGVMLRQPDSVWEPTRSKALLKMKPFLDTEATVTGFTSGRETDKGSKLLGMIGAIITDFNGQRLELSGMTNHDREFNEQYMALYATNHPGEDMPPTFNGKYIKVGDVVTFRYRELSDGGIPREARYLRVRND